jgi:TatD DNase family protein
MNPNYNLEKYIESIDFTKGIAIGEIGIDYKITKDKQLREDQKKLLIKQLEIANKLNKPVIIHSRFATKRVLEILKDFTKLKVVLHWFNGTDAEFEEAFNRGYYLTLNFDRNKIPTLKDHLDQIFIETDYPISYANLDKNILNIKKAYEVVSKIYDIDLNLLKIKTQNNFERLFPNIKL